VPIATIHVLEGGYDERRLGHVSKAVQDALTTSSCSKSRSSQGARERPALPCSAGTVADGVVPITDR